MHHREGAHWAAPSLKTARSPQQLHLGSSKMCSIRFSTIAAIFVFWGLDVMTEISRLNEQKVFSDFFAFVLYYRITTLRWTTRFPPLCVFNTFLVRYLSLVPLCTQYVCMYVCTHYVCSHLQAYSTSGFLEQGVFTVVIRPRCMVCLYLRAISLRLRGRIR